MVRMLNREDCVCSVCNSGEKTPPGTYGGSYCPCKCHSKKTPSEMDLERAKELVIELDGAFYPFNMEQKEGVDKIVAALQAERLRVLDSEEVRGLVKALEFLHEAFEKVEDNELQGKYILNSHAFIVKDALAAFAKFKGDGK